MFVRILTFALPGFALCAAAADVQFNRDVRPILADRCFACHGPDRASRKTEWRLDQETSARRVIASGELYRRITSTNPAQRMPPAYLGHDRLSDAQIETIG